MSWSREPQQSEQQYQYFCNEHKTCNKGYGDSLYIKGAFRYRKDYKSQTELSSLF